MQKSDVKIKVWIDQDLCTGDGICEEIAPAIFFGAEDGLYYVREANTEVPAEPTHSFHQPVDVPDNLLEATIDAAEECPGECIFLNIVFEMSLPARLGPSSIVGRNRRGRRI